MVVNRVEGGWTNQEHLGQPPTIGLKSVTLPFLPLPARGPIAWIVQLVSRTAPGRLAQTGGKPLQGFGASGLSGFNVALREVMTSSTWSG